MQTKNNGILWLTFSIWGIFLLPWLFMQGIFVDGLYYGTIARNWYFEGDGAWNFYLTQTQFQPFYSHPPMAFWLQGNFFALTGDVWYCDRLYALLMFLLSAIAILRIWALFYRHSHWLPLFCWLLIPTVAWSYSNNLLENTLTAFSTWAVYWALSAIKSKKYRDIKLLLVGVFTFLALLTKGPVGAFPLATPFIAYWLIGTDKSIKNSLCLFIPPLVVAALFAALLAVSKEAQLYFQAYWQIQLMGSFNNEGNEQGSHLFILWKLPQELLILGILLLLVLLFQKITLKQKSFFIGLAHKKAALFLLIALSASLPIIISPKQMGFYILPSTPFWALSAAVLLAPAMEKMTRSLSIFGNRLIIILSLLIGLGTVLFAANNYSSGFARDKERLEAIFETIPLLPKHATIGISYSLYEAWSLYGYFYRYGYISLDATDKAIYDYYLAKPEEEIKPEGYKVLEVDSLILQQFVIYKKL